MEKQGFFSARQDEINDWFNRAKEAFELAEIELKNNYYWGAIGRAYYAAFYAVRALLLSNGVIVKTHTGTATKFQELFVKKGLIEKEFGQWFNKVMEERGRADYDIKEDWTRKEAEKTVETAKEFIAVIKKIIKN